MVGLNICLTFKNKDYKQTTMPEFKSNKLLMHICFWARLDVDVDWSLVFGDGSCKDWSPAFFRRNPLHCKSQIGFGEYSSWRNLDVWFLVNG